MITPFIRRQLILFLLLTVVSFLVTLLYYVRLPEMLGFGQYSLTADLPTSGGLYRTSNVTYRGITVGKVTKVQPTKNGVRATLRISDRYKIPVDVSANVHSVNAVGEQYLDLVPEQDSGKFLSPGQTITKGTVPREIGPALDASNHALAALPANKIASLLDETARALGGLGPSLQRFVDSTQALAGEFKTNINDVNDVIANSAPIIDSQVNSGTAIERWSHNLDTLAAQAAEKDVAMKSVLSQGAPTANQVAAVFGDIHESLPQSLANIEILLDLAKRDYPVLETGLVLLPQIASMEKTALVTNPGRVALDINLAINQPPPCLTGFLPPSQWRSPADVRQAPVPKDIMYCGIPKDSFRFTRGARNFPCLDVPGKRAATPRDCRDNKPYVPLGTNPWYGDPNQIRNCPAPGARCDQPVDPGRVIQAPSINNGLNPAPADQVAGTPPPISNPLSRPGSGTVVCNGQQPNPCIYTPNGGPAGMVYDTQSGEVTMPDGAIYSLENSANTGDEGWKALLAPTG